MFKNIPVFLKLSILPFLLLFLVPILKIYAPCIFSTFIAEVTSSKDYLTSLYYFANFVLTFLGLCLGYKYFADKSLQDSENKKHDQISRRIDFLRKSLDELDKEFVNCISKDFKEDDIRHLKLTVSYVLENMTSLLDNNDKLLGFTNNELDRFLDILSLFDDLDTRFGSPITKSEMMEFQSIYRSKLTLAKQVCWVKSDR